MASTAAIIITVRNPEMKECSITARKARVVSSFCLDGMV